jgi:hypothetical protein
VFDVLYDLGDAESAGRALSAANDLHAWDAVTLPYVKIKEANLFSLQGRAALAWQANQAAADEAGRARIPIVAWSARLNLVKAAAREGRVSDAEEQLRAAEALFPALPRSGNSEIALHYHRALVLHARSDPARALSEIDVALQGRMSDDWVWELQLERALIARDARQFDLAKAASAAAIDALERMRADLGADELKAWLLPARRRPFEVLFELQAEAGDSFGALQTSERAFARTFLDAFVTARTHTGDGSEGATAIARASALREFLPTLQQSPVATPMPLAAALARIGSQRALLYFATERAVWVVVVADRRVKLLRLREPVAEIMRLADLLVFDPSDLDAARSLGRILLPAAAVPPSGDLYLVAPSPLSEVPFAALRPDDRTAMERWTLHFVPSLSALAALSEAQMQPNGPPVVLADADGDLSGARQESLEVARALGVEAFVGPAASRDAVRRAGTARLLHLAVHGGVGSQGAWLQLAGGELSGADVLRWKLRPAVVVLTSCSSAATRAKELWGSMAASFLAAGSRAVVASLWPVDDAVAREFAERFYQEGGAKHPARALVRSQRWLSRRGAPPSSWAGLVVLGDAGRP